MMINSSALACDGSRAGVRAGPGRGLRLQMMSPLAATGFIFYLGGEKCCPGLDSGPWTCVLESRNFTNLLFYKQLLVTNFWPVSKVQVRLALV